MATRTASQLADTIRRLRVMDIAELGNDTAAQNTYIYEYMSLALQKWARIAYQTRVSDALTINADGYQTFQYSSADITDMFEPLFILDANGREVRKRVSFVSPSGWWRESSNAQIHTKGLSGAHTLHYIRYPAWITVDADVPEFPPAGYTALIHETMGLILESKNYPDEANNQYAIASRHLRGVVMANDYARGDTDGREPSQFDVDLLRG